MNMNYKWILAFAPLVLAGCEDKIYEPEVPIASSGDDVLFSISNSPSSRTMYQDDWEEKTSQEIFWGNYVSGNDEYINIYSPNTDRGFAKYKVNLQEQPSNVAGTIVKMSEIGVQWGAPGPHTFYAFYPADKASTTLANENTIRATVETGQSPQVYKYKENTNGTLTGISSFKDYNASQYNNSTVTGNPKTIYGMPDMNAAVMVARKTMTAEEFGQPVPLQFNVLADVLDITLNGPVTPNTLGGNEAKIKADYIQIQAVTIEAVKVNGSKIDEYEIDDNLIISGSFDLNMSQEAADAGTMVDKSTISGNSTVQLQTSMTNADGGVYYPTLFVRGESHEYDAIDHLRLRAFLIPGQITGENLGQLRVHLQTNCGDFYQMLNNDSNFATGMIYPVKFGYFLTRGMDFNLASWIGQLNPDIYISELSIPGAWHAANAAYQGGVTLQEMYNNGIRAFEVATRNGTDLMQAGNFDQRFDINSTTENFEDPFTNISYTNSVANETNLSYGQTETGYWNVNGRYYGQRRTVSGTGSIVQTKNETAYIVPKFWLRLYRFNDNSSDPLSTAIINLAKNMNPDGLMFLEIGMTGETAISGVPYRSGYRTTATRQKDNESISGYEYIDEKSGSTYTQWNINNPSFTDSDSWTETSREDFGAGTFNLTGGQAWAIAVRSCLERLSTETNTATGKPVVYSGSLDANTTISMVQGTVIVKINTNYDTEANNNEYQYAWGTNTPALFSRWMRSDTPQTISLQWKSPVAPYIDGTTNPSTYLRWCFTELDNVTDLTARKNAITTMNETAANNYKGGLHRTFYETSLGGYLYGSATASNCQALAQELNPFTLGRITNPTRQACPLGLVFMNYAIAPNGDEATYQSAALIRAIINNNKAFLLNRADQEAAPQVENNANSHFTNNSKNPLK